MRDVGTFRTTILIESVERRGETRVVENALVATGSEFTWVPRPVLEELASAPNDCSVFSLRTAARSNVRLASGSYTQRGRARPTS